MFKRFMFRVGRALALALGAVSIACAAEPTSSELVARSEAALDTSSVIYFRSNATGWGVDETTRLLSLCRSEHICADLQRNPNMDDLRCGLGHRHHHQPDRRLGNEPARRRDAESTRCPRPPSRSRCRAPGGDVTFKVKYAVLGVHRVIVNFAQTPPTVEIQSQAEACAGVCPSGLVCSLLANGIPTCAEPPPTGP